MYNEVSTALFICGHIPNWHTVKHELFADSFFSRLGDFAISRILIFADAGTVHKFYIAIFATLSNSRKFIFRGLDANRENNMSVENSC